ncbi:MAG: 2-isopropylmalate synthase, partial [Thermoanaerobaculum sp.]
AKKEYLHLAAHAGVTAVDVGMPAAGPRVAAEVEELLREILTAKLSLAPNCAARTLERDIAPLVRMSQKLGVALEVMLFLGFSALRRQVEGWAREHLLRKAFEAVSFAVNHGLLVTFVAEDASRTSPEDVESLILTVVRAGANRVCLADTTGCLSPWGAEALTAFARQTLDHHGFSHVGLDWHGHNDRGLAVACALAAVRAGASRVHGSLLGIGERTGNAPVEQLLLNLYLLGGHRRELDQLVAYVSRGAELLGLSIPAYQPVAGRDAFTTATGVHAAAIVKAWEKGDQRRAELVYCPFPPSLLGQKLDVVIGPFSGASNVRYFLLSRGFKPTTERVKKILAEAKKRREPLAEGEIFELIHD